MTTLAKCLEPQPDGYKPRLWTVAEYHRAAEMGLFGPDEKLELLEGEIVRKTNPQSPPHATAIQLTRRALVIAFGLDVEIRTQGPITTLRSEPEPDIAVVHGTLLDYAERHPSPEEVLLLVEVADTTYKGDRGKKATAYAKAGIPDYWILNLNSREMDVLRDPTPRGYYRNIKFYRESEEVALLAAPDSPIRIADLLPPRPTSSGD